MLCRGVPGACALAVCLVFGLAPGTASGLTVPLNVEFDDGITGNFGTVSVEEDGSGGLFFQVSIIDTELGEVADLHGFFFNLEGVLATEVGISTNDDVRTDYSLDSGAPVWGGAGSDFQFRVSLGNGAGPRGNGVLQFATFTITWDGGDLFLDDLLPTSSTSQGIQANFAAHVQGTVTGGGSETVGGLVPEPGTAALVAAGMLSMALRRRSRLH